MRIMMDMVELRPALRSPGFAPRVQPTTLSEVSED